MKKLLIVDDEEGIRSLVRMTLDSDEFEIFEASKGAEAIELTRRYLPDIVLLDVMLPDRSGIEVCQEIKSDPLTSGTDVVMLTAKAQSRDVSEAETAGADGYFTKPFSPIALIQRVEAMLERR